MKFSNFSLYTFFILYQTYTLKNTQRLGLSFQVFDYLSFKFECFANLLQISKIILKKFFYFLSIDLSINFDFFLVFKIDTQIHTQKINEKDSQNTLTQNSNTQKIENSNTNLNL